MTDTDFQTPGIKEFITLYYENMRNNGIHDSLYLFNSHAQCMINNMSLKPYDMILFYSKKNIHRFEYNDICVSYQYTDNGFLINNTGTIYFYNFNGYLAYTYKFMETFLLKQLNCSFYITNYMINYIDI